MAAEPVAVAVLVLVAEQDLVLVLEQAAEPVQAMDQAQGHLEIQVEAEGLQAVATLVPLIPHLPQQEDMHF